MKMTRKQHKGISARFAPWRRALMAGFLAVALTTGVPAPAQANIMWDIPTLAATIAAWAVKLAKMAAEEAQLLREQIASAVQTSIPIMLGKLDSHIKTSLSQAGADNAQRAKQAKASGDSAEDALYPTQGQVCALTHAGQEASVAKSIAMQATFKLAAGSSARGTGEKADASSAAYTAMEINDLCKIGFLDTNVTGRYGPLPKNMGCIVLTGNAARYVDADIRLSSLVGSLQYPLPQAGHVNYTADGHLSFIGSTSTETAPGLGSELDYAAAYKFCEHLQPEISTPPHSSSTSPPVGLTQGMDAYAQVNALRSTASRECFKMLSYRTSCPAGSTSSLATGGASCHEAQKQLCARLTSSHAKGGLELTMQGDNPVFAAALANCGTEGISQAMYDAIMAYRCHDRNYAFRVLPVIMGNGPELERAQVFDCPAMEAAYKYKMGTELEKFDDALEHLINLRKTTSVSNSQPSAVAK